MNPIALRLSELTVGPAVTLDNLTMFPLLGPSVAADYSTLDDAIDAGTVEITEVSEQGSVPELLVVNRGASPTLIIDGEELVGAKQNRVVNLTILVAAASTLKIPVSCVEAGRWRARSRSFASAPRTQYASGRAKRMAQVSYSMRRSGTRFSDQSAVWDDIAQLSARLESLSPTSAMEQVFVNHAAAVDRYVDGCRPVEGQVGALFAIGDRIAGVDLFANERTLRKLLPKLVRSHAIDAIDRADARGFRPSEGAVPAFLTALDAAPQQRAAAVGLGEDVRMSTPGLVAAALVVGDSVAHLSGFAGA
jgi:hypothetical protein